MPSHKESSGGHRSRTNRHKRATRRDRRRCKATEYRRDGKRKMSAKSGKGHGATGSLGHVIPRHVTPVSVPREKPRQPPTRFKLGDTAHGAGLEGLLKW